MNNVKVFPLRFSEDFHARLVELAKAEGKSLHAYVIEVLEKQIRENN